ncbi:hypothetical protein A1332_20635 [Methylomonas methanica]|uniref:Uncharacterized protein n=2 Tax=Methylomonas methanica TaxID=421 RepID=A0A177LY30_METMH|nr:hypothetical protein A1332_20635 [Methylomonas methanica]
MAFIGAEEIMKTSRVAFTRLLGDAKTVLLGLALPCLLAACTAPSIKPAASQIDQLHSFLIVPVQAPPLEVIPDLIERRDPAYRHAQNMALGFALPTELYQTVGGIVIAGMVSDSQAADVDGITTAAPTAAGGSANTELVWTPARAAAQKLRSLLAAENRKGELSREYYQLPTAGDASLQHWHQAIQTWYGQNITPIDYTAMGSYDAVIEVGIGRYRIFEGQTSLQLLIKLIDPVSRNVIARTLSESFKVDDQALASLDNGGEAFKQLISDMAVPLLRQSLGDIGLRISPQVNES